MQHSLGGRFVFAPDEWKKGNAVREPSDIAWACNDCIILMYMAHSSPSNIPSKDTKKRNKAILHNLNQAKGWLREWRKGRALVGTNEFTSFSINHDTYKHIVVISITSGSDPIACYHHAETKDMSISMCATLPQPTIEALANTGAAAIDLLTLVSALRQLTTPVKQKDSLNNLATDLHNIYKNVDPQLKWLPNDDHAPFVHMQKMLHVLREPSNAPIGSSGDLGCMAEIFNDLLFHDLLTLIVSILNCIERVKPNWDGLAYQRVKLLHYDFIIMVSDFSNSKQAIEIVNNDIDKDTHTIVFYWVRYFPGAESFWMTLTKDNRPTYTQLFLDNHVLSSHS